MSLWFLLFFLDPNMSLCLLIYRVLQKGNMAKFLFQENQVFMRHCLLNVTQLVEFSNIFSLFFNIRKNFFVIAFLFCST